MTGFFVFFFITVLSWNNLLFAQEAFELQLKGNEKLIFQGMDLQINWSITSGNRMRIKGLTPQQGVRRGDSLVFDFLQKFESKDQFLSELNASNGSGRTVKVEILSPSLPLDIWAHRISFRSQGSQHPVFISGVGGDIQIEDNKGPLKIKLVKGSVTINRSMAPVDVNLQKGNLQLQSLSESTIEILTGQITGMNLTGSHRLKGHQAQLKLSDINGTMALHFQEGQIHISDLIGRLEGQLGSAQLFAQLLNESEVQMKSQSGKQIYQLPKKSSGTTLNILTNEGEIYGPSGLKVSRTPTERILKGKTPGEGSGISIHARSVEGNIQVKE